MIYLYIFSFGFNTLFSKTLRSFTSSSRLFRKLGLAQFLLQSLLMDLPQSSSSMVDQFNNTNEKPNETDNITPTLIDLLMQMSNVKNSEIRIGVERWLE